MRSLACLAALVAPWFPSLAAAAPCRVFAGIGATDVPGIAAIAPVRGGRAAGPDGGQLVISRLEPASADDPDGVLRFDNRRIDDGSETGLGPVTITMTAHGPAGQHNALRYAAHPAPSWLLPTDVLPVDLDGDGALELVVLGERGLGVIAGGTASWRRLDDTGAWHRQVHVIAMAANRGVPVLVATISCCGGVSGKAFEWRDRRLESRPIGAIAAKDMSATQLCAQTSPAGLELGFVYRSTRGAARQAAATPR